MVLQEIKYKLVVLTFLFVLPFVVTAQSVFQKHLAFEGDYSTGNTLRIYPSFPQVKSARSIDFTAFHQTSGNRYWHQALNYPEICVTLSHAQFGNNDILGKSFSLYPSLLFRSKISNTFYLNYKAGLGVSYFNKPYDPFINPENIVIGYKFTAIAAAFFGVEAKLNHKFSFITGCSVKHYSDGHTKVPNVGINNILYTAGVKFYPHKRFTDFATLPKAEINKSIRINLNAGLGKHEAEGTVEPAGGPSYPVYFGSIALSKRLSYLSQLSVGFNINYYTDYHDYLINQQIQVDNEKLTSTKAIVFAGYEMFFGHFSFFTQLGVNVYYPYRHKLIEVSGVDESFKNLHLSNRIGFNYYLFDDAEKSIVNPYLSVGIKTLGSSADFVETSIGFAF